MTIKVWDYLKEYALEREDILAAVDRVFSSGTLILGNSVKSFEEEFSSYCDAKFGIGVDNATNGLFQKLMNFLNTPDLDELDRLMRYQTTLQRQLSTAIGELLALTKNQCPPPLIITRMPFQIIHKSKQRSPNEDRLRY